jgi:hypothetical protein
MRLGRLHGADRLEAACVRAERLRSYRYRTVEHILTYQQDRLPLDDLPPARLGPTNLGHVELASSQRYLQLTQDVLAEVTRRHRHGSVT